MLFPEFWRSWNSDAIFSLQKQIKGLFQMAVGNGLSTNSRVLVYWWFLFQLIICDNHLQCFLGILLKICWSFFCYSHCYKFLLNRDRNPHNTKFWYCICFYQHSWLCDCMDMLWQNLCYSCGLFLVIVFLVIVLHALIVFDWLSG